MLALSSPRYRRSAAGLWGAREHEKQGVRERAGGKLGDSGTAKVSSTSGKAFPVARRHRKAAVLHKKPSRMSQSNFRTARTRR